MKKRQVEDQVKSQKEVQAAAYLSRKESFFKFYEEELS